MSDELQDAFKAMADSFINLANSYATKVPNGEISAAFLYAAARYNVFTFATTDNKPENWKDEAEQYFVEQYRKMLKDHLCDSSLEKPE